MRLRVWDVCYFDFGVGVVRLRVWDVCYFDFEVGVVRLRVWDVCYFGPTGGRQIEHKGSTHITLYAKPSEP